jgi:type I restriction enzyme S subunit
MIATVNGHLKRAHIWQRYHAYKPSGIAWLGEIPNEWKILKLKFISSIRLGTVDKKTEEGEISIRLCNYVDVYYNDFISTDLDFMEATASSDEIKKFALRKGDVLITKDSEEWRDIAVSAYVKTDLPGILCGYHLAHIRPDNKLVDGEYLFRSFQAYGINDQFRVAANGITRYGIGKTSIDSSLFLVPPIPEQTTIAAFLNHEMARIDALLKKKKKQIELLQEKRTALVSHAMTKGLNPSVPMKDSGIEWLGRVPEQWHVKQLRRVVSKFVDYRGKTPEKVDSGRLLITARVVKNGQIDFSLSEEFIKEEDYDAWMIRGFPSIGDVLITTEAPLGEVAQITDTKIALAQRIILLKAEKRKILNEFLKFQLMSEFGKGELWSRATGSTAIGIKAEHLRSVLIAVPPLDEQECIIQHINTEISKIEPPISQILKSIDLLQEYRSALISAAVTGKIDVRHEVTA